MSAPQYEIRTVRDFLRVPKGRRTQCLTEFLGWLAHVEQYLLREQPHDLGPFIWIDDGIGGIRTQVDDRRPKHHHAGMDLRRNIS